VPTLEQARSWYPQDDPVHGFDHVGRVYRLAEWLAEAEGADLEIVRAAALLHDAGGRLDGERISHQHASAEFARSTLLSEGWVEERIEAVLHAIRAHRFRDRSEPPLTLEAQVLFDADKLDAIGAIGAARAVAYAAVVGCPAYFPPSRRFLESGELEPGELHSAYHEFHFKLQRILERLHTSTARQVAVERQQVMAAFFERLAEECAGWA
jgi:uncharacterized protein